MLCCDCCCYVPMRSRATGDEKGGHARYMYMMVGLKILMGIVIFLNLTASKVL